MKSIITIRIILIKNFRWNIFKIEIIIVQLLILKLIINYFKKHFIYKSRILLIYFNNKIKIQKK